MNNSDSQNAFLNGSITNADSLQAMRVFYIHNVIVQDIKDEAGIREAFCIKTATQENKSKHDVK